MKEYKYKIKGVPYEVKINSVEENIAKVEVNGVEFEVELEKPVAAPKPVVRAVAAPVKTIEAPKAAQEAVPAGVTAIKAPLPGTVIDIKVAVGDTVKTTSGFYGVVIDITDDMVIVEFGNNKNCRIPMDKAAITDVEKSEE